jgi:hypothetical protein
MDIGFRVSGAFGALAVSIAWLDVVFQGLRFLF